MDSRGRRKSGTYRKIMLCYSSESLCKEGSVVRLDTLLERLEYKVVQGSAETEVTTLINDSRKVENGSVLSASAVQCQTVISMRQKLQKKERLH